MRRKLIGIRATSHRWILALGLACAVTAVVPVGGSPAFAIGADGPEAADEPFVLEVAPAVDGVGERRFIGRATLGFWQSATLPPFECPSDAPWVDVKRWQNPFMPRGSEAGSGDIRGYVAPQMQKRSGKYVSGWHSYWTNTITNWNTATQDIFIYVHCTSDSSRAGDSLS
jgi:hypothetical protein